MPSAPFPHLDALHAILHRASGAAPEAPPEGSGLARSLFPTPLVTAGALMWPWEHAHRVLHEWARWTRAVPDDVTSAARLMRFPQLPLVPAPLRGRSLVVIEVAIPREPWIADGRLAALRRMDPEIDTIAVLDPSSLPELHTAVDVAPPAIGDHLALAELPPAAIDTFVAMAGPASGANLLVASLRHLGRAYGLAAAGVPADADDAAQVETRLALLRSRMARFAAGRPSVEAVARAAMLRRRDG